LEPGPACVQRLEDRDSGDSVDRDLVRDWEDRDSAFGRGSEDRDSVHDSVDRDLASVRDSEGRDSGDSVDRDSASAHRSAYALHSVAGLVFVREMVDRD
jgi:hypothetical protein